MKIGTKAIHAGETSTTTTGSIKTPIYQTSTYIQSSPGDHEGYEYSRTGNPTRNALEKTLASLENGKHGICFASGMAAIDSIIKILSPGDEVISTNDLYGGTYRIFIDIFDRFGIKFHFIGMENPNNIAKLINENTKMIWAETPTNPMLNIIDIHSLGKIAVKHNLIFVVDNTFATPYLQRPLDLGANIECSDKNLIDFSYMGSSLYKSLFHDDLPKIALLNVGSEEIKGHDEIKKAYQFLKETK